MLGSGGLPLWPVRGRRLRQREAPSPTALQALPIFVRSRSAAQGAGRGTRSEHGDARPRALDSPLASHQPLFDSSGAILCINLMLGEFRYLSQAGSARCIAEEQRRRRLSRRSPSPRPLVDTFTFGFPQPIRAFGITFSSTFAINNGDYLLTTDRGDVIPSYFDPVFPGFSLGQFAGFISDEPFNSVTVSSTVNALYGMDDLVFARSVPEPSSLVLVSIGLFGLGVHAGTRQLRSEADQPSKHK